MKIKILLISSFLCLGIMSISCSLNEDLEISSIATGGIDDPVEPDDDDMPVFTTGGIDDPVEPDEED